MALWRGKQDSSVAKSPPASPCGEQRDRLQHPPGKQLGADLSVFKNAKHVEKSNIMIIMIYQFVHGLLLIQAEARH